MNHWITPTKRLVHADYVYPIVADTELRALLPGYEQLLAAIEPLRDVATQKGRAAFQTAKNKLGNDTEEMLYAAGCVKVADQEDEYQSTAVSFAGQESVLRDSWDKILELAGDEPIILYRK